MSYFPRTALDTNLKIEREWRTSLQEESVKDKERIGAMQMELKQLEKLKKVRTIVIVALPVIRRETVSSVVCLHGRHFSKWKFRVAILGFHMTS